MTSGLINLALALGQIWSFSNNSVKSDYMQINFS